jgi:SAM-dependent methyltransferase
MEAIELDPKFLLALDIRYGSGDRMEKYLKRLFSFETLSPASSVLDIGGGDGAIAHYLAHYGLSVDVIDPYADGEVGGAPIFFERLQNELCLPGKVSLTKAFVQEFEPSHRYDLVISHNSINHLDETSVRDLQKNTKSAERYRRLFTSISELLKPGGVFLISDCARRNLFGDLHLTNPFARSIEFELHQNPRIWRALLNSTGFVCEGWMWNSMMRTGELGRLLLGNRLGAYLTTSHFTLRAIRC